MVLGEQVTDRRLKTLPQVVRVAVGGYLLRLLPSESPESDLVRLGNVLPAAGGSVGTRSEAITSKA
jgi:hypothetical protein